jgi:pyridoxine 5-phosphate synthase
VFRLKRAISVPLNLEMSVQKGIVDIACQLKPAKACLVPERRRELTTEGGLNVIGDKRQISAVVARLQDRGVLVSLFVDPIPNQIQAAYDVDADFIELHTGSYAGQRGSGRARELKRLRGAAILAHSLGLGVNAGHGLDYENVKSVAELPYISELNIGHSIIARAVFVGIRKAVQEMRSLIRSGRQEWM